ncbi:MAG: PsiF family protein [Hyphomicrobiaceae bacterium]
MFRIVAMAAILSLTGVSNAQAQNASCAAQATEKKLAGAAKNSFMKKCETTARTSCSKAATDKKLAGAAKKSFETKCVTDAVGSK